MPNFTRTAVALLVALASPAAWPTVITQTVDFSTILPFGTFSTGNALTGGWSANPFPLAAVGQINSIGFTFSTDDVNFVPGGAPTGDDPAVEIGVLNDVPVRIGLSSVGPGNLTFTLFPGAGDPQLRFDKVAPLLLDGALTLSLGAFEDHGGSTGPMTLDEPSRLTITLDFTPANAPLPGTMLLLATGLGLFAVRRRR